MKQQDILFRARQVMPGGGLGDFHPDVVIREGRGSRVWDEDGNEYIDYLIGSGPMILGHGHPEVLEAVAEQLSKGMTFFAQNAASIELAEEICKAVPCAEQVRYVSTGTEADMYAMRLARAFTHRDKIVKFEGGYHGHGDSLLVKAGSGMLTFGEPSSPGVPEDLAKHTITLDYNNPQQVRDLFGKQGDKIACIIVEPIAGNMNCIPPVTGFLETLREVCDEHGALLIFDEVMTGFRVALGGAQAVYNIKPDLTTLGKIIGGGMPAAAFGGRKDIMQKLSPLGPVYQAGTLSGNPLAMAAGLSMLEIISRDGFYEDLTAKTEAFVSGMMTHAKATEIPMTSNQLGGMFGLFFSEEDKIETFAQVSECNIERFNNFFHLMLDSGINLAPSAYEAGFLSSAHSEQDIKDTLDAAKHALSAL